MIFGFGPFQLDEAARVLRLVGREVALQPRVFDLLVYLVQNRERVVSKDELLDKLWPDVTVTEASLQRAVSVLRAALREGGMEEAVRSFPRIGYRFCFDGERVNGTPLSRAAADSGLLDAAKLALEARSWDKAVALYKDADQAMTLDAAALSGWALALCCLGKPSNAVPILIRAIAAHVAAGDADGAASAAVNLSMIHFERGQLAVARGWVSRAEDLIESRSDAPALGRIYWMQSRIAALKRDFQRAAALAHEAFQIGQAAGDVELQALGLMYRGFYKLCLGDTRGGHGDQDRAAALALSVKLHPLAGGELYCNILWACRTFGDWSRANQWTLAYQDFCTSSGMEFSGACRLHRAEVLGVRGSLRDALAHVEDSISRLAEDAPWALGDAYRIRGDLHFAMGRVELARESYEQAYELGWDPEPGHAMLLLESGDAEAAYASLERSLLGQNWWTMQRRGILLAHLALVAAHAGRQERAETLIKELAGQSERWPMPSIRALANEASAILFKRSGAPEEALRHLHIARQLWTRVEARLEAARLRLVICELQIELGQRTSAISELRAACAAARDLQSERLERRCQAIEGRLQEQ